MPTREPASAALPNAPRGVLMAIGGHEDKTPDTHSDNTSNVTLRRFIEEIKLDGPVLVVPIASEVPEEATADYLGIFEWLSVPRVEVLDVRERSEADSARNMQLLNEAAALIFTGSDQLRLTTLLGGTRWLRRLKERYRQEEFVLAGTSAGAAAMSAPMIYQGRNNAGMRKGEIQVTIGLQFLPAVAIDTHFVCRGRIVRMAQIIAANPGCLGLGLEEDTGLVIREGRELEVIGSGVVTVVQGQESTETNLHRIKSGEPFTIRNLDLHILSCGERFTLPEPS